MQLMAFIVFRCDMHHILMCVRGDHCVNTIVVAVIMIMSIATSTFEHCDGAFCLQVSLKKSLPTYPIFFYVLSQHLGLFEGGNSKRVNLNILMLLVVQSSSSNSKALSILSVSRSSINFHCHLVNFRCHIHHLLILKLSSIISVSHSPITFVVTCSTFIIFQFQNSLLIFLSLTLHLTFIVTLKLLLVCTDGHMYCCCLT